jgi:hypothetical protein
MFSLTPEGEAGNNDKDKEDSVEDKEQSECRKWKTSSSFCCCCWGSSKSVMEKTGKEEKELEKLKRGFSSSQCIESSLRLGRFGTVKCNFCGVI